MPRMEFHGIFGDQERFSPKNDSAKGFPDLPGWDPLCALAIISACILPALHPCSLGLRID